MKSAIAGRTASLAFLTILAASASANLFVNPGFEDPIPLNGWTVTPTPNGQTLVQTTEIFETVLGVPSPAGKFAVGQVNFQPDPAGIELTQRLFLDAGVRYDFKYDVAARTAQGRGNSQGGIFTPIVNGNPVGADYAAGWMDPDETRRSSVTGTFTPTTSGVYTVGLRIARPNLPPPQSLFQYVDSAVAVPEPATAMALLGGLAALALRRRRKYSARGAPAAPRPTGRPGCRGGPCSSGRAALAAGTASSASTLWRPTPRT